MIGTVVAGRLYSGDLLLSALALSNTGRVVENSSMGFTASAFPLFWCLLPVVCASQSANVCFSTVGHWW